MALLTWCTSQSLVDGALVGCGERVRPGRGLRLQLDAQGSPLWVCVWCFAKSLSVWCLRGLACLLLLSAGTAEGDDGGKWNNVPTLSSTSRYIMSTEPYKEQLGQNEEIVKIVKNGTRR